ncbi:MAG: hypothetical protein ACRCYU_22670 [Nocardioides sp.]
MASVPKTATRDNLICRLRGALFFNGPWAQDNTISVSYGGRTCLQVSAVRLDDGTVRISILSLVNGRSQHIVRTGQKIDLNIANIVQDGAYRAVEPLAVEAAGAAQLSLHTDTGLWHTPAEINELGITVREVTRSADGSGVVVLDVHQKGNWQGAPPARAQVTLTKMGDPTGVTTAEQVVSTANFADRTVRLPVGRLAPGDYLTTAEFLTQNMPTDRGVVRVDGPNPTYALLTLGTALAGLGLALRRGRGHRLAQLAGAIALIAVAGVAGLQYWSMSARLDRTGNQEATPSHASPRPPMPATSKAGAALAMAGDPRWRDLLASQPFTVSVQRSENQLVYQVRIAGRTLRAWVDETTGAYRSMVP